MKQSSLKKIRVVFSILLLLSITLIFIDFRDIFSSKFVNSFLFLQFVPSLIKFINVFSISALGFLLVLILTFAYGRVYCSALCPLGILQDVIAFISKKVPRKKKFRYKYKKAQTILRYSILGLTVISLLFGTILMVNLLDPYSNFGRIVNNLFKPLVVGLNNLTAAGLEKMDVYSLYPIQNSLPKIAGLAFPILVFVTLIVMSLKNGRLYCNTICPVGTLLGFLSKYSIFKIKFDANSCTSCGKCAVDCKSECISIKEKSVDESRCVSCFNCISVCPEGAIKYQNSFKELKPILITNEETTSTNTSKRNFIASAIAYLIGTFGVSAVLKAGHGHGHKGGNSNPSTVKVEKEHYACPPGSVSLKHMNNNCTACHLCVSSCPTKVLQPSFSEHGISNMMQPYMDYHKNYCNFECTKCSDICPTGAILPVTIKEKKTLQIGIVNFVKENCIVYTDNTACGSCSEHCPTQAVFMVPYKDNLTIPEVNTDICVGCGACEYACPIRPYRAIYVEGNILHATADMPVAEKLEGTSKEEEFPF